MAIEPIRIFGDPILTSVSAPVEDFGKSLKDLVEDLKETLSNSYGVGLAAPQIGVPLRVFAWYSQDTFGYLVNPTLTLASEVEENDEGCLSIPGFQYPTVRSTRVIASGFDMHQEPVTIEGTELLARIFQHETDHLDGILFIERLSPEYHQEAMKAIANSPWYLAHNAKPL